MPPEYFPSVPCGQMNTPLWPHHTSWTVSCCSWGRPTGHMTGDFHCKGGRQEVEWKPGLSTVSLNTRATARPSPCQQAQLGQALRWPIVQWGLHICTAVGVSLWPACRGETGKIRGRHVTFYHHIGSQFSCGCRQKYLSAVESQHEHSAVTAHDETGRLFILRAINEESTLNALNLGPQIPK